MIGEPLGGPTDLTTDVSFSRDGKWLAAGRFDGGTVVYDTKTRRAGSPDRRRFGRHRSRLPPRREPHRRRNDRREGAILRSEDRGGRRLARSTSGSAAVWQVGFSPDGRLLAVAVDPNGVGTGSTASSGRARCSSGTWTPVRRVGRCDRAGRRIGAVRGLQPRRHAARDRQLRGRLDLWDVATQARHGKPMRVADDGFLSVAFDPSGRLVAGGGAIGPVRVWRVADQRPAFPPLAGHTGPVTGAAFDPAGSFLATTSLFGGDQAVGPGHRSRLRRRAGRKPETRLAHVVHRPSASSGCGTRSARMASCWPSPGVETLAMLWDVDPAVWRQRACAIVGRNLSREEWKLYLPPGTPYRATCSEWPTG